MNRTILTAAGILLAVQATQAGVVFDENFNSYADVAALKTAWANTSTASGNYTPELRTVEGNSYLAIRNGIVYKDIGQTITENWTVSFSGMQGVNSRGQWAALTNAAGTQGYMLLWDSGTSGVGSIQIRKFNLASAIADWGATGSGTSLKSGTGNQNINTTPFAQFELTWDKATGKLTARENGSEICSVVDTSFSEFSRVYLRGNGNGGTDIASFDNIKITTDPVPEAASVGLLGLGVSGLLMRRGK